MVDYNHRKARLKEKMDSVGLDLVVYGAGPDHQYLTGTIGEWREHKDLISPAECVFVPRRGDPKLLRGADFTGQVTDTWIKDIRCLEMFQDFRPVVIDIIKAIADSPRNIGIGEYVSGTMTLAIMSACKGTQFHGAEGLLDDLRMIKEADEIEKLQKVASLTDGVMEKIIDQLKEGDTMQGLGLAVEAQGRKSGVTDVSFPGAALFYKSGSEPQDKIFNYEKDQGLESETSIAFDVGFVLDGYCSDWGRSVYFGKAEDQTKKAYEVLQRAVVETVDSIGEEIHRVNEIFPAIEAVCDREKYGDFLRKRLADGVVGHQIGLEVHEDPWLKPSENHELEENMAFCIEPKLWHNGEYYLRVEDMVCIRNGKGRFLTNYDRERFEL